MTIKVDVRLDLPPAHGKPVYRRTEFGLVYDAEEKPLGDERTALSEKLDERFGIDLSPHVFVSADTLTLVFRRRDGRFLSLDAYTNDALWARQPGPPASSAAGALVLAERIEERVSLDVVPTYSLDVATSTLRICLGGRGSRYFKVGDDLFVGLSAGQLAEVVLTNIEL